MIDKGDYIKLESEEEVKQIEREENIYIVRYADRYGGGYTEYVSENGKRYIEGYYREENPYEIIRNHNKKTSLLRKIINKIFK